MASNDNFEDLELKGIIELGGEELGRGAYGRVYAVKYCETVAPLKKSTLFWWRELDKYKCSEPSNRS